MSPSLFSDLWYRVADTRPKLRPEVTVQRQFVREERWYLLLNAANSRQFRLNHRAYDFLGRCDGTRTVQTVWDALLEQLRDDAPTQGEVIEMLAELERQDLLAHDGPVDASTLVRRRDERAQKKTQRFVNPLALRVTLGDPSALLAKCPALPKLLFNGVTLWAWLGAMALALLVAAPQWRNLSTHAAEYMGTPRYLFLAWLVFPFLKSLHELAHALSVRRWGGEVHEVGFTLFVLVPAPYVDASAASAFTRRYQRFVVGAAGMMAELAVGALALLVWMNAEPGLIRDSAFVTLFIATVSTLMFNGNPLLRFDAYYLLCDALDLPNLGTRSKMWWRSVMVRALGGKSTAGGLLASGGEAKWLFLYAPLSLAAQMTVSVVLVLWLGGSSTVLAVLAALVLGFLLVIKPGASTAAAVWKSAVPDAGRTRAAAAAAIAGVTVILALCAVPLPFHTVATGVVWPPEQARVRPGTDGFIAEFQARDGDWVVPGQILFVLDDPALHAEHGRLVNRLEQLHASRYSAFAQAPADARQAEEEIIRAEAELKRIGQRIASLAVRAETEGALVMPYQRDLAGTFVRQGSTLAYVLERTEAGIRAAIPEFDAALVREGTRAVEVRFAGGNALAAQFVRDVPAATFDLPSPALGDRGGGPHATDPADKEGLRARQPVVLVDIRVPAQPLERLGGTALVRFDHGPQPLAQRWYRQVRQVFLQHLNPAG
jgi:putative peptide zinc metalloprotease protein